MKESVNNDSLPMHRAKEELHRLEEQIEAARAELARLQGLVGAEEGRRENARLLVEVNEQMVASILRADRRVEATASQLEELSRSAQLDELTGLPNRALMFDRCAHAIANAKRHRRHLALLFVDLDNFKNVNDMLGHATGDEALKLAAQCIVSGVREADTVSRHGGDEFLILLDEVSGASDAVVVANKVIAALDTPHLLGDQVIRLEASIGISIYPEDGESHAALIAQADAAMYIAKRSGSSVVTARRP